MMVKNDWSLQIDSCDIVFIINKTFKSVTGCFILTIYTEK